ncbi:MAG: hypothetical protein AAGB46_03700 [Verrucomicrobiota bacterium]
MTDAVKVVLYSCWQKSIHGQALVINMRQYLLDPVLGVASLGLSRQRFR